MDQHLFIEWAQENYEQLLMDPTTDQFEKAHYPWSKKRCDTTVPLHWLDHAIQGIWQSEEQGDKCFNCGPTTAALYKTPNYWPPGWFEACDVYEKWAGDNIRKTFKGKAIYRLPDGTNQLMTKAEAEDLGATHVREGNATYRDPATGETAFLTSREAEALGWEHTNKGNVMPLWKSTVDGYVGTAANVANHNRHRGWSAQDRVKVQ